MTRAGVGTFPSSCSYIFFFFLPALKIWSSPLLASQKYQGHEILVKQITVTGWVLDWQAWQCTRYSQSFTHLARPICWTETSHSAMWLRLWSGCITLKSPFNRQSQVTPHLINRRLVHSLLCPTHISASESPTGADLVAGITSHVKRLGQGTSSALHVAFGSRDLLGQSAAIVVEETQSPLPSCQHDPLLIGKMIFITFCLEFAGATFGNMCIVLVHSEMTVRERGEEDSVEEAERKCMLHGWN